MPKLTNDIELLQQNGDGGAPHDLIGHAAQQQLLGSRFALCAHHNEIHPLLFGKLLLAAVKASVVVFE